MSPNSDSHDPGQTGGSDGNLKMIDLEFETLRQFREVMAPRLNYEGFFVATNDPLPKGTPAKFRFLLPDGFILVEGTAVVAWTRGSSAGPDDPAGMALLFNELEHQSREIIDELIDFHIATGGDPFELGPDVGEPGDIGTDSLMGESVEAQILPPEPEPKTAPEREADVGKSKEEFLPDWLSEVAEKHDVDLTGDVTVPTEGLLEPPVTPGPSESPEPSEIPEPSESPEASEPVQQDFEVSLMPEEEELDETPFQAELDEEAEVAIPSVEKARKPPRDLRLWPFAVAAVVVIGVSAIVFWYVNRDPGEVFPEPIAVVEEIPVPEPTPEVLEETTAEEVVGASPEESAEAAEVEEPEPVPPPVDRVSGPATRVLLVATARVADATVVTVKVNGDLTERSVRVSRLKDPARVWIRIQGIETFYRPNDIAVGTPEVERVRVGHHPEETPQSIYVVCDLASPSAVIRQHTITGDTLRIVVGRQ
jgi:hypothetical protein